MGGLGAQHKPHLCKAPAGHPTSLVTVWSPVNDHLGLHSVPGTSLWVEQAWSGPRSEVVGGGLLPRA